MSKRSTGNLQVGDVFVVAAGMWVYTNIPEHFAYGNTPKSMVRARAEVRAGERLRVKGRTLDLGYLEGAYVVERAACQGGGTAHGPHDVYPDGWCVTARKLFDDGTHNPLGAEVSFYQSGAFTIVHKNIPTVGRMCPTFVPG